MNQKPDAIVQVSFNPEHLKALQDFGARLAEANRLFREFLKGPGLFQGEIPESVPGGGQGEGLEVVPGQGD